MIHSLKYGRSTINFYLKRTQRKTLGIEVYPDTTVQVIAPENATLEKIMEKVEKRGAWILRQQRYFNHVELDNPEKSYVSGETFRYLGRQYRLRVREIETEREAVKLKGAFFYVFVKDKNNSSRVKTLMDDWYARHARAKFRQRLEKCFEVFSKEGIEKPPLRVRKMKKRWGSCTPSGVIQLNPVLIKTPVYCIDYVIFHELCHLIHPNHSSAFYRLKEKYLPDWRWRKKKLEEREV